MAIGYTVSPKQSKDATRRAQDAFKRQEPELVDLLASCPIGPTTFSPVSGPPSQSLGKETVDRSQQRALRQSGFDGAGAVRGSSPLAAPKQAPAAGVPNRAPLESILRRRQGTLQYRSSPLTRSGSGRHQFSSWTVDRVNAWSRLPALRSPVLCVQSLPQGSQERLASLERLRSRAARQAHRPPPA